MGNINTIVRFISVAYYGVALLIFMNSCEKSTSPGSLVDTQWRVVRHVNVQTGQSTDYPKENEDYRIIFNTENAFSLPYRCNYSNGKYNVDENRISFTKVGPGTEMYCQGLTEWEDLIIPSLNASHSFLIDGNTLVISSDDSRLYFQRLPLSTSQTGSDD